MATTPPVPAGVVSCPVAPRLAREITVRSGVETAFGRIAFVPGPISRFSLSSKPVLALDLGGTQIRAAVVLPDGTRLNRVARPTPVDEGPDAILTACAAALRESRDGVDEPTTAEILAIAVSSPGPVDPWRGVIMNPPNLGPAFHAVPIATVLSKDLGLPVFLDRDTNIAALGEMAYGAARGVADFLYITVSTGFGGAIMTNGQLMLGPDGTAGEVGHLQVELDGPLCGCGGVGHVEALCSGRALARDAAAAATFGRSPFLAARAATKAPASLDARDVVEGAAGGDAFCDELLDRARDAFAAACVGIVNLLNPSLIVVGGSIAEHLGDALFGRARQAVAIGTFPIPGGRVRIVPAGLGPDVSLAGAQPLIESRFGDPAWPTGRLDTVPAARA